MHSLVCQWTKTVNSGLHLNLMVKGINSREWDRDTVTAPLFIMMPLGEVWSL